MDRPAFTGCSPYMGEQLSKVLPVSDPMHGQLDPKVLYMVWRTPGVPFARVDRVGIRPDEFRAYMRSLIADDIEGTGLTVDEFVERAFGGEA